MMFLNVKLDGVETPEHAKKGDAGLDLTAADGFTVMPGETVMVRTGVSVEIPRGYCGLVLARSGIASKRMLAPINAPGLIDSGYRGEVMVPIHNYAPPVALEYKYGSWSIERNDGAKQTVEAGERIAQLVIVPFEECFCIPVDELSDSERGTGGFGSTGEGVSA